MNEANRLILKRQAVLTPRPCWLSWRFSWQKLQEDKRIVHTALSTSPGSPSSTSSHTRILCLSGNVCTVLWTQRIKTAVIQKERRGYGSLLSRKVEMMPSEHIGIYSIRRKHHRVLLCVWTICAELTRTSPTKSAFLSSHRRKQLPRYEPKAGQCSTSLVCVSKQELGRTMWKASSEDHKRNSHTFQCSIHLITLKWSKALSYKDILFL